ncbi:DUF3822 family protein [Thalassotalea sp. ND16A]|uniref:DUF3822 family protein n=1 Tax=Thalassotalea sp. ND16A TaxID=1535422 RepID=UPI000519F01C|nr:DUF3822 family protein [Thalassotalea sp. ND16A]KGJ99172.1 hypothetical protein ND16A_3936 [Thalassotalea sp. ND16A]
MFKTVILSAAILSTSCYVSATDKVEYNSNTAAQVQSIFWLNNTETNAIAYAKFEAFHSLKMFIDASLLTAKVTPQAPPENANKLLLMLHQQQQVITVFIDENNLYYNGFSYEVDKTKINQFQHLNDYRTSVGDSITEQELAMVIKNYGFKYLAK